MKLNYFLLRKEENLIFLTVYEKNKITILIIKLFYEFNSVNTKHEVSFFNKIAHPILPYYITKSSVMCEIVYCFINFLSINHRL